eukprot:4424067-Alexandrium_andersonii.AAC.1
MERPASRSRSSIFAMPRFSAHEVRSGGGGASSSPDDSSPLSPASAPAADSTGSAFAASGAGADAAAPPSPPLLLLLPAATPLTTACNCGNNAANCLANATAPRLGPVPPTTLLMTCCCWGCGTARACNVCATCAKADAA